MFGTLKPKRCQLPQSEVASYERYYCGLCKSLGDSFGLSRRALLSYDAVLLALLADGLTPEAAPPGECRCPVNPMVHRPIATGTPVMRYAAAVQVLLADQWLADRSADAGRWARVVRRLFDPTARKAWAQLRELGVDLSSLSRFESVQLRAETIEGDPVAAAEPTAAALGLVFEKLVELGIAKTLKDPLKRLGRALGQTIYLIDALEDLRKDTQKKRFNPCLVSGEPSVTSVHRAAQTLEQAQAQLEAALAQLPLQRHRPTLQNVLRFGLRGQASAAARDAQTFLEGRRTKRLPIFVPPAPRRSFLAALIAWWAALGWTSGALAKRRRDAGLETSHSSTVTKGLQSRPKPDAGPDIKALERLRTRTPRLPKSKPQGASPDVECKACGNMTDACTKPCKEGCGVCDACKGSCDDATGSCCDCASCTDKCCKSDCCKRNCAEGCTRSCCKECDCGSCCKSFCK